MASGGDLEVGRPCSPPKRSFYPPGCSYNDQPGYVGNLSVDQRIALKLLKTRLREAGIDLHVGNCKHPKENKDAFLLRFLRARNFHVENAKKLLVADVQWRVEQGIEELTNRTARWGARMGRVRELRGRSILECDPVDVNRHYPHWTHKTDKFGRPVLFEKTADCNMDKVLELTEQKNVVDYHIWRAERNCRKLHRQTECTGYQVDTFCSVVDVKGMGLSQVSRKFLSVVQEIAAIDQDHYPERLGVLFICNIPRIFWMVWAGVKPWLSERTTDKIKILTSSEVNEELAKHIDLANLPEEYGGTCRCEGGCLSERYDPDEAERLDEAAVLPEPSMLSKHRRMHSRDVGHRRAQSCDSQAEMSFHSALDLDEQNGDLTSMADSEFDDEELTPEEAAALEATRQALKKNQCLFRWCNTAPYALAVVLITLAIYARAALWWDNGAGRRVTAWCVAGSFMLGCVLLLTGFIGNYGVNASRPMVLQAYGMLASVFALQILALGIAVLGCHQEIADMVSATKEEKANLQDYSIAYGSCAVVAAVLLGLNGYLAFSLKSKIEQQPDPVPEDTQLRFMLRIISAAILLMATVSFALGWSCSLLASYTSNYVFGIFVFTVGSLVMAVVATASIVIASSSKTQSSLSKLNILWWTIVVVLLGLIGYTIATGISINEIQGEIASNWQSIKVQLNKHDDWRNKTQDEIVATLEWNRIFVVAACCMQWTLFGFLLFMLGKFVLHVKEHAVESTQRQVLTLTNKLIVIWACVAAFFQLFWQSQYLLFMNWLSVDSSAKSDYSQSWFVASWFLMGDADDRYSHEDHMLWTLELFAVILGVPLCLLLAWGICEKLPSRYVVGLMASALQIYHALLYFISEASDSFDNTPGVNTVEFWMIFVLVTLLRFVVPIPIFVHCWRILVRSVAIMDAQPVEHSQPDDKKSFVEACMPEENTSTEGADAKPSTDDARSDAPWFHSTESVPPDEAGVELSSPLSQIASPTNFETPAHTPCITAEGATPGAPSPSVLELRSEPAQPEASTFKQLSVAALPVAGMERVEAGAQAEDTDEMPELVMYNEDQTTDPPRPLAPEVVEGS